MKIIIGCDHAGYELKEHIKSYLNNLGFEIIDCGTNSLDSVDYPDYIHPVAKAINENLVGKGIIICGSGNGVNMVANKYLNVRSALCWKNEIVELARQHNDANILALPARYISQEEGIIMVETFLNTQFEGGRHIRRVEKIKELI